MFWLISLLAKIQDSLDSQGRDLLNSILKHFSYRLQFLATQCLRDWHWYQARRAPSTQVQSPGPHRMCLPPQSVCAPLSAHMARQFHCCPLWPGGGGGEELVWRQEIPSVKGEEEVERERNTWDTSEPLDKHIQIQCWDSANGCHKERKWTKCWTHERHSGISVALKSYPQQRKSNAAVNAATCLSSTFLLNLWGD